MSAQPDTDRSLNADKPATEPGSNPTPTAAATNAAPDLSGLTREQLEARVKTLTENLAQASTESEYFRQQWQELRLRNEALGVEALTVDERKLEDKLVQAVKELYQSEMKRREALQLLDKLLASNELMLRTAPNYDPKVRADYEVASRAAKDYVAGHDGAAIPLAVSLSDGRIADVNQELNAVVLNLGKSQGVKEGMLFFIYQNNAQVGTARIVLARDLVSAGLVENLRPNTVLKVGDRVAVNAGQ
jgi:hypothetical protein